MHGPPFDLKIRAYVCFVQAYGAHTLIDCLLRNEAVGIHYGEGRDYDGLASEKDVIQLLKTGR
jgi:hypothetical protein